MYLSRAFYLWLSLMVGCTSAFAQNANDIVSIFGGLIKSAIQQSTLTEWKKLPQSEVVCVDQSLRQQGSSLQAEIQHGITPTDPRIASSRSACLSQAAQQSNQQVRNATQLSTYVVDGLALGGQVKIDSEAYRSYKCAPSEQFEGFTWCQKKVDERVARGQFTSSYSILHSPTGAALYINRYLEPAWFAANEANDDINSRSKKYGAPSRIIPMPRQSIVPNGMIATWGNVVLEPLDSDKVRQLAAGRDVHAGFMIDHIGNFQRSAEQGLPIYRLIGGAGYVWAASWNQAGVGTLRFLAIDASATVPQISEVSTKVEPAIGANQNQSMSNEQRKLWDADLAKREAASNFEYIRATRTRISDRFSILRNVESKQKVEEISARLATANAEMSSADLKTLRSEADSANHILEDAEEFSRVTEIAGRRVIAINTVLDKITSDAPIIQTIQAGIKAVKLAQSGSNLRVLQDALKSLNDSYDNNRKALQAMQFDSP